MFTVHVDPGWSLEAWREKAREALVAGIGPDRLQWEGGAQGGLAMGEPLPGQPKIRGAVSVPAALLALAATALCHRDPRRHALLYRILWRVVEGERRLLDRATDSDVVEARALAQAVRRDSHKMKAFVRFRRLPVECEAYVAWFEPAHWIVDRVAPFFARRFAGMRWAILTPYRSVRWDGRELAFGPGAVRSDAPTEDAQEDLWRTYYTNIFNPARINPTMMRQEMPQKYWRGLPEATLLPTLLRDAGKRVQRMVDRAAEPPRRRIPQRRDADVLTPEDGLQQVRARAAACRRCELWAPATQTVWGEGPEDAGVMVIGEQPGDEEDLTGRPFVGPAGRLFDHALADLGIDRSRLYVTNAVKHFRFERRGKARMHKNPAASHVRACELWLHAELATVRPQRIVCLGATAARAVFGRDIGVMQARGRWQTLGNGVRAMATVHPSWILRQRSPAEREAAYAGFVEDLRSLAANAVQNDDFADDADAHAASDASTTRQSP